MKATLVFLLAMAIPAGAAQRVAFFCELPAAEFKALFEQPDVLSQLKGMSASVRVGLLDLSPERAATIQKLNRAGIPVAAWLLLPESEGYWFNMTNGEKAARRYADFKRWTDENHPLWQAVGIDLEPNINEVQMMKDHPWRLAWRMYTRLFAGRQYREGREQYARVVAAIRSDGYTVESYVMPVVLDDRARGTTSIQKVIGILDLQTDREVPMLYSSFGSPASIIVYHEPGKPIAIGSTGGGVKIGGEEARPLSWEEFSRDLLLASHQTDEIYIFSLEGCVAKGWLSRIARFDFAQPPPDIASAVAEQEGQRRWIQRAASVLDRPIVASATVIAIPAVLVWGAIKIARQRRRRSESKSRP